LPEPTRVGEIKFIYLKNLPYRNRLGLIFTFFVAGIFSQLFFSLGLGIILLGLGTLLSLVQGYADKPKATGEEVWSQVTPDEYWKVISKETQHRKWDLDCFDITNRLGSSIFFTVAAVCCVVWYFLGLNGYDKLASYWVWDCLIIFLPHWVTGVRSYLTKDKLVTKIRLLQSIMDLLSSPSDIQVLPMLSTSETKDKGKIPMDARLMLRFLNAPSYFLGLQVQISINSVQGTDYPYLYCVLIAKQEAQLFKKKNGIVYAPHPEWICLEETQSEDVDVLVIRQYTTKTSGYHTNNKTACAIVEAAVDLARRLIADQ
jgi:hypothetical protein